MKQRPKKPDPNWARVQANTLSNLGRAYLSEPIVPKADAEPLRYAAELVELHVNVVLRAIERHPDELARVAAIASLSRALTHAFTIGNWHYESPTSKEIVQPLFRAYVMRKSPRAIARTESNALRLDKLRSDILNHVWPFKLADSDACAKKVRKGLGYKDAAKGYSLSTFRRAIAAGPKTTPKKKEDHS